MKNQSINTEPRSKEIRKVIKQIKRSKATGPDSIPMQLLKQLDEHNSTELQNIIQNW